MAVTVANTEDNTDYESLPEILEEAIRHEEESHTYYLAAAERVRNPDLQRFLRHLAQLDPPGMPKVP